MNKKYDAIIIGSGMGALTVGSLLAQFKDQRVLILERHFKLGGFTHSFKRKRKFVWDVGVHYIGDLQEGGLLRTLFDLLTKNQLTWRKMDDPFEKFVYPDFTFDVYSDPKKYQKEVTDMFPDEAEAIENYFSDVRRMNQWFARNVTLKGRAPLLDKVKSQPDLLGGGTSTMTTADYFDRNFKSEKLKALLVSQWGDYGLPPKESSFAIHCSVVGHYFNGGYYPEGSAGKIAELVVPIIEEKGGLGLVNHEVQEIIIEDGKAVGVKVKNLHAKENEEEMTEFRAPTIISNAGAFATYNRFLKNEVSVNAQREQVFNFYKNNTVTTSVSVYIGLKTDPRVLGFNGANHWIYSSYDHEQNFSSRAELLNNKKVMGAYLTFPSLKDNHSEGHTSEIIAFTDYEPFKKWKDQPWKKRDEDYKRLKEDIADALINYIDNFYPGYADLVEYKEVSTPITIEYFTDHPIGSIYGMPSSTKRFFTDQAEFTRVKTPLEGLYLTGVDVSSPGVAGALMGGVATAQTLYKDLSLLKLRGLA